MPYDILINITNSSAHRLSFSIYSLYIRILNFALSHHIWGCNFKKQDGWTSLYITKRMVKKQLTLSDLSVNLQIRRTTMFVFFWRRASLLWQESVHPYINFFKYQPGNTFSWNAAPRRRKWYFRFPPKQYYTKSDFFQLTSETHYRLL